MGLDYAPAFVPTSWKPLRLVLCLGLACAALVSVGCGGSDAPEPAASVEPPNLVSAEYIDAQVRDRADGSPAARVALEFWRDIQYANFSRAYARLSEGLRREVAYSRFLSTFRAAQANFYVRPRVQSVETSVDRASVFLLLQAEARATPRDVPLALEAVREQGTWRIASDPGNVLGVPAPTP